MHIALSRFTNTHTFMDIPSTIMVSLPTQHPCPNPRPSYLPHRSLTRWLVQLGARCRHTALTCSSHRHHHSSCRYPTPAGPLEYQHRPLTHLIAQPRPEAPLLTSRNTPPCHAQQVWGRCRHLSLPAASTRHTGCDPQFCFSCQCRAPHSHQSCQQLVFRTQTVPNPLAAG